jgi:K+-transporting ATPase ATPase B chain
MVRKRNATAAANSGLISRALGDAFRKLDPRTLIKNPVIFVTGVVAAW